MLRNRGPTGHHLCHRKCHRGQARSHRFCVVHKMGEQHKTCGSVACPRRTMTRS